METPVTICRKDLDAAWAEGMDEYLDILVKCYLNGEECITAETMQRLNADQITLLAYHVFREEVMDGGFCQLIQNGYGPFIFKNPFAKVMRLYGLTEFAKVVNKAGKVYQKNWQDLMRERTDEEFMAMYEQYEAFDSFEDWYVEEEEQITAALVQYVRAHQDAFVQVSG